MLFCSSWPKGHHLTHRLKHTHSSPFFTPDSGITTHLSTVRQAAPCIEIGPWCLTSSFLKLLITSKGGKSMQRESTTWLGKTMKQRCISLSRHEINPILNLFKLTPSHHLSGKERLSRFARFGNQYRCWRVGHFACLYNLDEHGLLLSTGTWHWQEEKIEAISYHPEVSGSQLSLLLNKLIPPQIVTGKISPSFHPFLSSLFSRLAIGGSKKKSRAMPGRSKDSTTHTGRWFAQRFGVLFWWKSIWKAVGIVWLKSMEIYEYIASIGTSKYHYHIPYWIFAEI